MAKVATLLTGETKQQQSTSRNDASKGYLFNCFRNEGKINDKYEVFWSKGKLYLVIVQLAAYT